MNFPRSKMMLGLIIISAIACFCGMVHNANASAPCLIWGQSAKKRDDYTYIPGVGAYKLHKRPTPWHEARRICDDEGGYLAIINSVAEANAIVNLFKHPVTYIEHVYIGFHDFFVPGEYVTMHGQSLSKAGFDEWAPGEPNTDSEGVQNCGALQDTVRLHNILCTVKFSFVCELSVQ